MCHNSCMSIQGDTALRWIPRDDTFGARLALVRQRFGWNLKEASLACGLPQNAWLEWESKGRVPRNIAEIALKISEHTDVDDYWLMTGKKPDDVPTGPRPGGADPRGIRTLVPPAGIEPATKRLDSNKSNVTPLFPEHPLKEAC